MRILREKQPLPWITMLYYYFLATSCSYELKPARMGDIDFKKVCYRVKRVAEGDFYDPQDAVYYVEFLVSNIKTSNSIEVEIPILFGTKTIYVDKTGVIAGNKVGITPEEVEGLKSLAHSELSSL